LNSPRVQNQGKIELPKIQPAQKGHHQNLNESNSFSRLEREHMEPMRSPSPIINKDMLPNIAQSPKAKLFKEARQQRDTSVD
jgi:hypothetical protein